jgi:hypothetical protein
MYRIDLATSGYEVASGNFALRSTNPFGINITADALEFFPRQDEQAQFQLLCKGSTGVRVGIDSWPEDPIEPRRWTLLYPASPGSITERVSGLKPHQEYDVLINGKLWRKLRADNSQAVEFKRKPDQGLETFGLVPVP